MSLDLRLSAVVTAAVIATASVLPGHAAQQDQAGPRAPDVVVQAPAGGWRASGLGNDDEQVAVAYPPTPIDRGAQKYRTIIRGRLKAAAGDEPHVLVVNGNPMPLYTGKDGRFARPYAFAPGSNSVEVRSPDGRERRRIQFYEANANRPAAKVRALLTWDDDQADIDLHVITPDGQHAFWADPVLDNGGGLDVDSVDGAGPEMFSMPAPLHGVYHLYLNYWGNFGANGYHFDESTRRRDVITAMVTLVFDENTPKEKRQTIAVPMRKIGELAHVRSFVY